MRTVRKDDLARQRHLLDGLLTAQGISTFAIVYPARVTNTSLQSHKLDACTRDSVLADDTLLPDVISRCKR